MSYRDGSLLPLIFSGVVVFSQLVACSSGNNYQDLKVYVTEVQARPPGKIKPPPEFKPHPTFTYSAAGLRSPFILPMPEVQRVVGSGKQVFPDFTRTTEYLEDFNFDGLSFVGSIERRENGVLELWALIRDSESGVHRVKKGDYLGKNHGKVARVSSTKVDVVEIVPSGGLDAGGSKLWIERPRSLVLRDST